ncbi:hypothetical protein ACFSW8_06420 [Rubritalea tangerina]|uniref:eRF1 domain-containing protein n=2 Tax=Rubritalea tangerina TaxID=430798 RepID=A0ABW4Z9E5_9BACT
MKKLTLKKHLIALASLPETNAPILSVYFDASYTRQERHKHLKQWAALARHAFRGQAQFDFDDALEEIHIAIDAAKLGHSLAIFSRWGEHPLVLPMHLKVPVETQCHAGTLPIIYPLVEIKDRFDRFILVSVNSSSARIFEINLGDVSQDLLKHHPELRSRIGKEWTREHYQNHRSHRDTRFIREKIAVIDRLMSKRGHNALIIAGESKYVSRLKKYLPKHLTAKLSGELKTGAREETTEFIVQQSIQLFLEQEHRESFNAVQKLERALRSNGLAAMGTQATLDAIRSYRADLIILSTTLPDNEREMVVRAAANQDLSIETVQHNNTLERYGGVGCLLRYLPPKLPLKQTAQNKKRPA